MFWWSLKVETIKKLIFQEFECFTIYNPAYFISKLEASGFTIGFEDERTFNVEYMLRDKKFSVKGISYFLNLITYNLYTEDEVLDLINRGIKAIDEANIRPNTKCEFRFIQHPMIWKKNICVFSMPWESNPKLSSKMFLSLAR